MRRRNLLSAVAALAVMAGAQAQDTLKVGDAAPPLNIDTLVKPGLLGEKGFSGFEPGRVYIVEFWATWCVPCKASIPHLSKLQERYADKGLTIIGISDEETDVVEPFVRRMAGKMEYAVATDYRNRTKEAYLEAAGMKGIPAFFLVDGTGTVVLMGNPHPRADAEKLETVLRKVLTGRYDPKLQAQAERPLEAARGARKARNWRQALKGYDEIIALKPAVFVETALERFDMLLVDMNDRDAAYTYLSEDLIEKQYKGDAGALKLIAEHITSSTTLQPEHRDLDVALVAAEAAAEKFGPRSPEALAVVADVRFHRGEIAEAIDLQKRAWMMARPHEKDGYRRSLDRFNDAKARAKMP